MKDFLIRKYGIFLCAALLFVLPSCEEKVNEDLNSVQFLTSSVGPEKSNQWLKVKAAGEWTLVLSAEDMQEGESISWARLATTSGTGNQAVLFSWDANTDDTPRSCYVEMTTGGKTYVCDFTQAPSSNDYTHTATVLVSDPVPDWMELPKMEDEKDMYFITHDMVLSGKTKRNYSFYFDKNKRIAHWVAYPHASSLIGSGDRTNAWGVVDPKVPTADQAIMTRSFSGYDRGHQLPSADRYGANVSTFYGTNMTPQLASLNQHGWMVLEGKVRSWMYQFDTLYVVTGADVSSLKGWSSDAVGKQIAVPCGYYKALLGYVKNTSSRHPANTASTGGWAGIAFYFKHEACSEDDSAVMAKKMSIDALEQKLGIDFFPLLPTKTQYADKVESTVDSWWK